MGQPTTRPQPNPSSYCTVWHARSFPIDAQRAFLEGNPEELAIPVRRCLCISMAHAGLPCDPLICTPELTRIAQSLPEVNNPAAYLCHRAKQIYRGYVARADAELIRAARSGTIRQIIDELWEGDHPD